MRLESVRVCVSYVRACPRMYVCVWVSFIECMCYGCVVGGFRGFSDTAFCL